MHGSRRSGPWTKSRDRRAGQPALGRHMDMLCAMVGAPDARQVRRTLLSVIRYVQRMTGRATPNGLFAGVAPAAFAERSEIKWGPWHKAMARADAAWMNDVISVLEACPDLLCRLPVVATNTSFVRGDRLIVPYPARSASMGKPTAEVSLRFTSAVRTALDAARSPITYGLLADKVKSEFPDVQAERVMNLLTNLLRNRGTHQQPARARCHTRRPRSRCTRTGRCQRPRGAVRRAPAG